MAEGGIRSGSSDEKLYVPLQLLVGQHSATLQSNISVKIYALVMRGLANVRPFIKDHLALHVLPDDR